MANRLGFTDTYHFSRALVYVACVTAVLSVWGVLEVRRVADLCFAANGRATTNHDESEAVLCVVPVPGMVLP